jgi:uncharacterized protein
MSDQFSENVPKRRGEFSEGVPRRTDPRLGEDGDDEPSYQLRPLPLVTTEDRLVGVLVHWGGFLSWILAPLVLYLMQQNRRSLAAWHSREAFNFQLSLLIYYVLPWPLMCLAFIDIDMLPLAIVLPIGLTLVVMLFELVVITWASIAAYQGRFFRCPLNIPFIPRPQLSLDMDDHADLD